MSVSFDNNGYTTEIRNTNDDYNMNWVLNNSDWGKVDGFEVRTVNKNENGIDIISQSCNDNLCLVTQKSVSDKYYTEKYTVTNNGTSEFFLTHDNFGIHFPYNCTFCDKKNMHDNSCITHIWCGGDITWMYSAKPSGSSSYLVCYVSEGAFCDYGISYDLSRVCNASSYRGDIVLHPEECVIAPNECVTFCFVFCFSELAPDSGIINDYNKMYLSADKYSVFKGETIECLFKNKDDWKKLKITCNGQNVTYKRIENTAVWNMSFSDYGEKKIVVNVDDKHTWMYVNVLEPIESILVKRARFIVEKQQYNKIGSRIDGAYLIYDRETKRQYYSESFKDNNAARERLSMGVTVAVALQIEYDEKMMNSLRKHRKFVEREIFDIETATVYNGVNHDNAWHRAYNYPWMAVYYLEWYKLTKEVKCIENSAKIIISYYEKVNGINQESPCLKTFEIYEQLKKNGLDNLSEKLKKYILAHAEKVLMDGSKCYSAEVSCTQGLFNGKINSLCQGYLISGKEKYLKPIPELIKKINSFSGYQPDYHINLIAVRYWDLYWFGKSKTYGDSMPQWISAMVGETYIYLYKAGFGQEYKDLASYVLKNNLCVFFEDGFASGGYLVPYKVTQYSLIDTNKPNMRPRVTYGKKYDEYANDQDWALYYAVEILKNDNSRF